jgi:hypothetical protein
VSPIWAFVRNLRTSLAMLREKAQADEPRGREYQCVKRGADCPVVAVKWSNAHGAKGAGHSSHAHSGQPATGGTDGL